MRVYIGLIFTVSINKTAYETEIFSFFEGNNMKLFAHLLGNIVKDNIN